MFNKSFVEAVISLFKAVPAVHTDNYALNEVALMRHGVYVAPEAVEAFPAVGLFADYIIKEYGYDLASLNGGLHKSFHKVKSASDMKLYVQQALHYLSVYLQNGMDDTSSAPVDSSIVYVPNEVLSLPEDAEPVRVSVIRALSVEDIISRARKMLASGMALSEGVQAHLFEIVKVYSDRFPLDGVANKEFRVRMMDELFLMPSTAGEFVRYLVYKKTGSAMLIHGKRSVGKVMASSWNSAPAFAAFVAKNGVEEIARNFNRHRDLWVSFKHDAPEVATIINKARKLSVKMNQPAKIAVLDRVASASVDEVRKALKGAPLAKKVAAANSLLCRASGPEQAVYFIRNGRVFVKSSVD